MYNNNWNHSHYHYNNINFAQKVIKPDFVNYLRKLKIYKGFSILGVIICFIAFPLTGFMQMRNFGATFYLVFIPFFGFGFFGFLSSIIFSKYTLAYAVYQVLEQIQSSDKILIKNISYQYTNTESDILYIVKQLINTGNLEDYELIDDVMVARKDLHISHAYAENTQSFEGFKTVNARFCPYCRGEIRNGDNYCNNCGRRL